MTLDCEEPCGGMPEVASLPGQTCTSAMAACISLDHGNKVVQYRAAVQGKGMNAEASYLEE